MILTMMKNTLQMLKGSLPFSTRQVPSYTFTKPWMQLGTITTFTPSTIGLSLESCRCFRRVRHSSAEREGITYVFPWVILRDCSSLHHLLCHTHGPGKDHVVFFDHLLSFSTWHLFIGRICICYQKCGNLLPPSQSPPEHRAV